MVDLRILERMGSTRERLRQIFTAALPDPEKVSPEEYQRLKADYERRAKFEAELAKRLTEGVAFCLRNYQLYAAVDLAWDAQPICKETIPLVMYAQGKLDLSTCADQLTNLGLSEQYVQKNDKGQVTGIDLPAFLDVNINLVRSMVTRRLAAQANKYNSLYPYYRYHPRSTTQAAKLYAEVVDGIIEEEVDAWGHREHDEQVQRQMLLYARAYDFIRSAWETEEQLRYVQTEGLEINPQTDRLEAVTVREGVQFVEIHPTRVFKDTGHPWTSINSDNGILYCGYWDVVPWRNIALNQEFFNRDCVTISTGFLGLFEQFKAYWHQYYTNITLPSIEAGTANRMSQENDARSSVGRYTADYPDAACMFAVYFLRVRPIDLGCGDYPHPVWLRVVTAGQSGVVVYAEWLPSRPAAVASYNCNDSRLANLSFAMEMMPFQDALTNLFSQLIAVCKSEQMKALLLNKDCMENVDDVETIRRNAKGRNWFVRPMLIEYSGVKMAALQLDIRKVLDIVQPVSSPGSIQVIFQTIVQTVAMAERMAGMSPNESGQPIVRGNGGVTATEAQQIENTTNAVYAFISDAIDRHRAAKKRILYESYIAFGKESFQIPALSRFSRTVVEACGFQVVGQTDLGQVISPEQGVKYTIVGKKNRLPQYDYVFSSRDGAERSSNVQAANTLVQLLPVLSNPLLPQALGDMAEWRDKFINIVNEVLRLSGAGVDVAFTVPTGSEPSQAPQPGEIGGPPSQQSPAQPQQPERALADDPQLRQTLTGVVDAIEKNSKDIFMIQRALQQAPLGGNGMAVGVR